ncbi:nucleoside 2-deoxyribosyltransferase [Robbsia sp. KACC 23696]|uniref:nucleoside 2-deoxyribosyltransferase n=1 Tax=Robbsia sp. KACC 23696 TaxID=3149231 RepID=UPI00325ABD8C
MQAPLKIYLAGPDVFFRDPIARGAALRARCAAFGFAGHFPLDAALPPDADDIVQPDGSTALPPTPGSAMRIYRANIALLRGCDAVMANVQDFRGAEPDSGTVFEIGYAVALGLPVWAYGAPDKPISEQVAHDAAGRDSADWQVEDFGLPRNLMLSCSSRVVAGGVDACLADMRAVLIARTQPFVPGWIGANWDRGATQADAMPEGAR